MQSYTNEVILKAIEDGDVGVLQAAIDNGTYIGNGIARQAIAISDGIVAKVPFYSYCEQTQAELCFYDKHYEKYAQFMPKMCGAVSMNDYKTVLFMERVTPLDGYISKLLADAIEDCELRSEIWNDFDSFLYETQLHDSDSNVGNWGRRDNGEFVVLDCGMHGPDEDCYGYTSYNYDFEGRRSSNV